MGNSVSSNNTNVDNEKIKQEKLRTTQLEIEIEARKKLLTAETEAKSKLLTVETEAKSKLLIAETEAKSKLLTVETEAKSKVFTEEAEQAKARTKQENELGTFYSVLSSSAVVAAGIVGIGLVGLAADYAYNGSTRVIRWRVRRALTSGNFERKLKVVPPKLLPTYQEKLIPEFLPVILLGPSGCGKSTLLSTIARERLKANEPVLYLSIRGNIGTDEDEDYVEPEHFNAVERMNEITERVLSEMGYPVCDPIILPFLRRINRITIGETSVESQPKEENKIVSRFSKAITCLFDVCNEIRDERLAAGYTLEKSAPSLLLDEVHDLIRDERLAKVGGRAMFKTLGTKLVSEGVSNEVVRSVIAGSNGKLALEVDGSTVGNRVGDQYRLEDPKEKDLIEALNAKGFTDADCERLINFCGTRLRLYDRIFKYEIPATVDSIIERWTKKGKTSYAKFFAKITDPVFRKTVIQLIDIIYKGGLIKLENLPPQLQQIDFGKIIFIEDDGKLIFQSKVIKNLWPEMKEFYSIATSVVVKELK